MRKWIHALLFGVATAISSGFAQAQGAEAEIKAPPVARQTHLAFGGELSSLGNDFGLGLRLTSPYLGDTFALRLQGGLHWKEGLLPDTRESTWQSFGDIRLGIVSVAGELGHTGRVYSEGGAILLIPSDGLGSELGFGGYGVLGIEFYGGPRWPISYFIEAGGVGSSGRASGLEGEPSFANGFIMQVGLHWYPY